MSDPFIEQVTLDDADLVAKINAARSPFRFIATREVDPGDVIAGAALVLSRPLTLPERTALRAKLLQWAESVEPGLVKDFRIARGFKAFRAFTGRLWRFVLECHLRSDEAPMP